MCRVKLAVCSVKVAMCNGTWVVKIKLPFKVPSPGGSADIINIRQQYLREGRLLVPGNGLGNQLTLSHQQRDPTSAPGQGDHSLLLVRKFLHLLLTREFLDLISSAGVLLDLFWSAGVPALFS